jgi:hypothetical protein
MRLDGAVYVLARPKAPSMPTRRAFVIAGCTFAAGMVVGSACGYSAGVAAEDPNPPDDSSAAVDAERAEFHRLATTAPIDELMAVHLPFVNHARSVYLRDAIVWRGVRRIAEALLNGYVVDNRRASAIWIAQTIEAADVEHAMALRELAASLRQIR